MTGCWAARHAQLVRDLLNASQWSEREQDDIIYTATARELLMEATLSDQTVESSLLQSYIKAGYTASEGYAEILRRLQAALAEAK
jgi:hypothetical protein